MATNEITLRLDPVRIVETVERLRRRIGERFPDSGLSRLSADLLDIARHTQEHLDEIDRPVIWLRTATWLMAAMLVAGAGAAVWAIASAIPEGFASPMEAVQVVEAGIQDAVFVSFGIVFLVTAENRLRRKQALGFIRELRALAHIVDMHQLTKDPDRLLHPSGDTASSPTRELSRDQLGRYLDYCSEILSLTSKLAALYADRFTDSVVLQAVDEVEALTSGLSNKIWQKIMILDQAHR